MWSFFSRDPLREFQYEVLEKEQSFERESVFTLNRGKSKVSGDEVSIFIHEKTGHEETLEGAKSSVKRLKTLRHPNILTYMDSCETENHIYLVTEHVQPLLTILNRFDDDPTKNLYYSWGIMQVVRALYFMNNDANLRHNNLFSGAVFVNDAGEWKVGEVGYVTGLDDPYPEKPLDSLLKYSPPEIPQVLPKNNCAFDSWGLGLLIWEVYNGRMNKKSDLQSFDQIPKLILGVYCELVAANPSKRPNASQVLRRCSVKVGFFSNPLVDALLFLEEIHIKDKQQKVQFFNDLVPLIEKIPENLCRNRMLPQLLNAFEFGEAGVSVFTPLIKVGSLINGPDYQKLITPCIVKLFGSNDRATRCKLLQHLSDYIDKIPDSTINQKIFPMILHGFLDTNPVVREFTVKAVVDLAPKLDHNNLNVEVLKHFAKIQSKDEQSGIRTNTTVCLGKIAPYLQPQVRQKVLISAFIRALHDPFPPARAAGVLALVACQQFFKIADIAERVLPALCQLTTDAEPMVRENVFRAIKGFLAKLEKVSENPELKEELESGVTGGSKKETSWAEWALSAISQKLRTKSEEERKSINKTDLQAEKNKNQGIVGSLELTEESSEVTVDNQWGEKQQEIAHIGADDINSSEGWDVGDWSFLDNETQLQISETKGPIDDEMLSSAPLEKETLDNAGNRINKRANQEKLRRARENKDSEKCKARQSAPLKLGTKIS